MVDEDDVRQCICLNLRRGARQVTQFYDDHLRSSGLRTTQFQLLAAISKVGPTPQQPLADVMGMDRTTLTRNLALLEKQDFVRITQSRTDRREREVDLTPAGRKILKQALPLWREAQSAMKQKMSADPAIPAFPETLGILTHIYGVGE